MELAKLIPEGFRVKESVTSLNPSGKVNIEEFIFGDRVKFQLDVSYEGDEEDPVLVVTPKMLSLWTIPKIPQQIQILSYDRINENPLVSITNGPGQWRGIGAAGAASKAFVFRRGEKSMSVSMRRYNGYVELSSLYAPIDAKGNRMPQSGIILYREIEPTEENPDMSGTYLVFFEESKYTQLLNIVGDAVVLLRNPFFGTVMEYAFDAVIKTEELTLRLKAESNN